MKRLLFACLALFCIRLTAAAEKPNILIFFVDEKKELQALFDKWNATMQPPRWEDQRWNGEENRKGMKKERRKGKAAK